MAKTFKHRAAFFLNHQSQCANENNRLIHPEHVPQDVKDMSYKLFSGYFSPLSIRHSQKKRKVVQSIKNKYKRQDRAKSKSEHIQLMNDFF